MQKSIVVLFGPSGSGKTFVAERLCQMPVFSMIKKATSREIRTGGHFSYHIDKSIKFGGNKHGANYFDLIDGVEGDFLTENYGHSYSISLSDIDSALEQYKVPVLILRTREQIQQLAEFYPEATIHKFYLRPDFEINKSQILNDKSRSKDNKQERILNLQSDYDYHDKTSNLDPSVHVLKNDYQNGEALLNEIVQNIQTPTEKELQNRQQELKNQICLGDKIRITHTKVPYEWKCDVIMNNRVKFSLTSEKSLDDLIKQIQKYLSFSFTENKINELKINPIAEDVLTNILNNGNSAHNSWHGHATKYAFDIQSNKLGFDCFFSQSILVPDPPEDYDRDYDTMPYVSIGYKRCSSQIKTQSIGVQEILHATSFVIDESKKLLTPNAFFNKPNGNDYLSDIDKLKYKDAEFNNFANNCLYILNNLEKQKQPE